jgi:hypothetical protein
MKTKRDEVLELVERLRHPLHMGHWDIKVDFSKIKRHRALSLARPEYEELFLYFDLRKIRRWELPAFVLHEMVHGHTERLAELAVAMAKTKVEKRAVETAEENTVRTFERILLPLLTGGNGHGSGT